MVRKTRVSLRHTVMLSVCQQLTSAKQLIGIQQNFTSSIPRRWVFKIVQMVELTRAWVAGLKRAIWLYYNKLPLSPELTYGFHLYLIGCISRWDIMLLHAEINKEKWTQDVLEFICTSIKAMFNISVLAKSWVLNAIKLSVNNWTMSIYTCINLSVNYLVYVCMIKWIFAYLELPHFSITCEWIGKS